MKLNNCLKLFLRQLFFCIKKIELSGSSGGQFFGSFSHGKSDKKTMKIPRAANSMATLEIFTSGIPHSTNSTAGIDMDRMTGSQSLQNAPTTSIATTTTAGSIIQYPILGWTGDFWKTIPKIINPHPMEEAIRLPILTSFLQSICYPLSRDRIRDVEPQPTQMSEG